MYFYFRVRDYRTIVVDFLIDQFFTELFLPLCRLQIRHLTSSQPHSVKNYLARVEQLFKEHRI